MALIAKRNPRTRDSHVLDGDRCWQKTDLKSCTAVPRIKRDNTHCHELQPWFWANDLYLSELQARVRILQRHRPVKGSRGHTEAALRLSENHPSDARRSTEIPVRFIL